MKIPSKFVIFSLYFAIVFFLLPLAKHHSALWLEVLVSVLFVVSYSLLAGGRIKTPIFIVFIFSLAFPIVMLVIIGLPAYHTVFATAKSIISSLSKQQFGVLEMFFPFLAALVSGFITITLRSNPSFKRDA